MDTEGPVSVLDRRSRESSRDRVITDRITRRKSPGPQGFRTGRAGSKSSLNSGTGSSIYNDGGENEDDTDVVYRIAQPYRTSFSAKRSVMWGKPADRCRSLSPTSFRSDTSDTHSILSVQSAIAGNLRRPRNRSKSPKRVTYDTRVTVRHSDTEDSMFTELSSTDYNADDSPMRPISNPFSRAIISPRYNEFSRIQQQQQQHSPELPSAPHHPHQQQKHYHHPQAHAPNTKMKARYRDHRTMARDIHNAKRWSNDTTGSSVSDSKELDSGLDFSSEIKDISSQITKMDWSPRQPRASFNKSLPPSLSSPTHQRQQQQHPPPPHHHHYHYPQHHRNSSSSSSNYSPSGGILKDSQNSRVPGVVDSRLGSMRSGIGVVHDGSSSISNRSPTSTSSGSSFSPQHFGTHPTNSTARNGVESGGKENDPLGSPTRHHLRREQQQQQDQHQRQQHLDNSSQLDVVDTDVSGDSQRHNADQQDDLHCDSSGRELTIDTKDPSQWSSHTPSQGEDSSPCGSTGGTSPGRGSPIENGRLTPSKRSFSLSITNFLKRFSPHLRRRKSGRGSKTSSAAGSAQSLETGQPFFHGGGTGATTTTTTSSDPDPGGSSSDNNNALMTGHPHPHPNSYQHQHQHQQKHPPPPSANKKWRQKQKKQREAEDKIQGVEEREKEEFDREREGGEGGHFKRSSVRQSLLRLVGRKRSGSRSKKRSKGEKHKGQSDPMLIPTPSHYTIELQDPDKTLSSDEVDEIINTVISSNNSRDNSNSHHGNSNSNGKPAFNPSTSRMMKSIEDHKSNEKDIYKKFKERNSPKSHDEGNNLHGSSPLPVSGSTQIYNYSTTTETETESSDNAAYYKSRPASATSAPHTSIITNNINNNNNISNSRTNSSQRNSTPSIDQQPNNISMEFFTETDLKAILNPHIKGKNDLGESSILPDTSNLNDHDWTTNHTTGDNPFKPDSTASNSRVIPPSSLDVTPSRRSARSLQTSVMSNISGDESIGECSLDANLTASEPSLLSSQHTTNGSQSNNPSARYVHLPQSLVNSTTTATDGILNSPGHDATAATTSTPGLVEVQLRRHHNNHHNSLRSPKEDLSFSGSDSGPPSPSDPSHKPSYLKLACAIGGYGKYSRYSTYKDVNKPSPFSSQNSLRSGNTSPELGMPAERKSGGSGDEMSPLHNNHHSPSSSPSPGWRKDRTSSHSNGLDSLNGYVVNGQKYPTGDITKDGEYFLQHAQFEDDRLRGLATRAEAVMRSEDIPEEACGRIRSAIGKANLLLSQKFVQFRDLCQSHMHPDPEERETKWEDLQGFWDMIKIQVDILDDTFAEIELMKANGWQEIPKLPSRRSSASSSPKSANVSQASTPSATPAHTPGTKRKNLIVTKKDTPESSPERTQKARHAAKVRDEARRKMLAEKRAAMKQQQQQLQQQQEHASSNGNSSNSEVEIYLPDSDRK